MRIIDQTISEYEGYLEFAQDGIRNCHPNDEQRFKTKIKAYEAVLSALYNLKEINE